MKRKRGHKKAKHKQSHHVPTTVVNVNPEYTSVLEDQEFDNTDSEMEDQLPAPSKSNELPKLTNTLADRFPDKPLGQGRVKVKLKSSKLLEPHSDAQTQSDTDKSSSHLSLEKQEEVEKRNDAAHLLPEIQPTVSSRKTGSIKIKSSRGIGSLSTPINPTSGSLQGQSDRTAQFASDILKTMGGSHQNENKISHQDPRYNKKELNTALEVIRKIMKMDAAEPFNAPVNPIALGIPDYFDIIETPMDFGTICSNLEQGHTYKNSEDVYKDVQYIWENCYRYNNKGDYIVDLMKRVKKNFMKYWTAAGLYSNQPKKLNDAALGQDSTIELPLEDDPGRGKVLAAGGIMTDTIISKQENVRPSSLNASERLTVETATPSNQESVYVKGTHLKHKKRGRHGFNKHKSDCLCAVCVVRRRRKERERDTRVVETQIELSDGNMSQEFKQEETSIENHCSEEASSNLGHSPDPYEDADMEDQSEKMKFETPDKQNSPLLETNEAEYPTRDENDHSDQFQAGEGSGEEPNPEQRSEEMEDSGMMGQKLSTKEETPPPLKEEALEIQKLQQKHDSQMMQQQTILCENLLLDRNPSIMKLCGTLFPSNHKSVWSGPHSLGRRNLPPVRKSSAIHAALEMFMK